MFDNWQCNGEKSKRSGFRIVITCSLYHSTTAQSNWPDQPHRVSVIWLVKCDYLSSIARLNGSIGLWFNHNYYRSIQSYFQWHLMGNHANNFCTGGGGQFRWWWYGTELCSGYGFVVIESLCGWWFYWCTLVKRVFSCTRRRWWRRWWRFKQQVSSRERDRFDHE